MNKRALLFSLASMAAAFALSNSASAVSLQFGRDFFLVAVIFLGLGLSQR